MKLQLTKTEMLALWKRRHFLESLRADCRVIRSDSVDIDTRCVEDMRAWYLNLLRTAPREYLSAENITRDCIGVPSPQGYLEIVLPQNVIRVLTVRMPGWEQEAEITTDLSSTAARLQANRYSQGGVAQPVALHLPAMEVLRVYSPLLQSGTQLDFVEAVTDPGPESYVFDESAIALIHPIDSEIF